jgi:hypothetical protein
MVQELGGVRGGDDLDWAITDLALGHRTEELNELAEQIGMQSALGLFDRDQINLRLLV